MTFYFSKIISFLLLTAGLLLAVPVQAQPAGTATSIRWLPARPLRITDFKLVRTGQRPPDNLGRNMAVTRTGFIYSVIPITSGANKGKGLIRVYAQMDPSHSYIIERVLKGSAANRAYLLNHEQKHFDISEIYARELSRFLRTQPLGKSAIERITAEVSRLFKELNAFQKKYDAETDNGRNKQKQEQWNALITQRLNALSPYAAKDYILSLPR